MIILPLVSALLWQCVDLQAINVLDESATSVFRPVLKVGNHPQNYSVMKHMTAIQTEVEAAGSPRTIGYQV